MNAIFRLMRLNKPIGIYLLWFPTSWALVLTHAKPIYWLWFTLGTIVMRSAGCIINDIADRKIDLHVTRTQHRPLTSGEVSLPIAFLSFIILMFIALIILIQLPSDCFYAALPAAGLTLLYPFCKRFLPTPQMILSLAFASSIPMVYLATHHGFDKSFYTLISITILWVICYDTEYALVDLEDDKKVGIFSTALFFGKYAHTIILIGGLLLHLGWLFLLKTNLVHVLWGCLFIFWIYQYVLLNKKQFFTAFLSHTWYGLSMFICLLVENFH